MLNTLVTEFDSAHPINSKIATQSQEIRRNLAHCSLDTPDEIRCQCLEKCIAKLRVSGYDNHTIAKIVRNGILAHIRSQYREKMGGRKVHRSVTEGKDDRVRTKMLAKTNWYKPKSKIGVIPDNIVLEEMGGGGGGGKL